MVLEHHGTVGTGIVDLAVLEQNAAAAGLRQARHNIQERGLAAAGVADDGDVLALLDVDRDVLQDLGLHRTARERLADVIDPQIAHCSSPQLAAVPRVTIDAVNATMRSRMKPMMPT